MILRQPLPNAYTFSCIRADLPQLADRRKQLTKLLGTSLSRWRTSITAWTIYYMLSVTLK